MTAAELTILRKDLVARLAAIYRTVHEDVSEAALLNRYEHDASDENEESAVDEREVIEGELTDRDAHHAEELRAALDRMRTGEYGVCIDCGQPIPFERLRAVPWTTRCAVDQAIADGGTPHATL